MLSHAESNRKRSRGHVAGKRGGRRQQVISPAKTDHFPIYMGCFSGPHRDTGQKEFFTCMDTENSISMGIPPESTLRLHENFFIPFSFRKFSFPFPYFYPVSGFCRNGPKHFIPLSSLPYWEPHVLPCSYIQIFFQINFLLVS